MKLLVFHPTGLVVVGEFRDSICGHCGQVTWPLFRQHSRFEFDQWLLLLANTLASCIESN
jgi:hypothetical protein